MLAQATINEQTNVYITSMADATSECAPDGQQHGGVNWLPNTMWREMIPAAAVSIRQLRNVTSH